MTDYSQGKIYKVWSPNCEKVYYGSTTNSLTARMSQHKHPSNLSTSKHIVDAGGADIKLIETFSCLDKYELEDREAEIMLADWEGCVNEMVPGAIRRAGGEKEYKKKHYEENAVKISVYQREYNEKNAEKLRVQHKEYREKNAVRIKAYREKIATKINCECGGRYTYANRKQHIMTKMHKAYISTTSPV